MFNRTNNEAGFTLIELIVVVGVIGILASISIAVYTNFLKKARTVEAKSFLSDLARQQTAYYVGHAKYTDDVLQLGLPALGTLNYYTINVFVPRVPKPQRFIAVAKGNIDSDADLDEWTIDHDNNLLHTRPD